MTPEEMIAARVKTHGDYDKMAEAAIALSSVFQRYGTLSNFSYAQVFSLGLIGAKLARILTGDPNFRDHWDDIAGYAKLAADRCSKPAAPPNGAEVLGINKPPCHCSSEECMAEKGTPPKHVYCKKAENAVHD